jgi:hypothetical protein
MPFRWVATPGIRQKPYVCIACGQAPIDENGPKEAYWMEGSDVNWGDSTQLCCSCARIVGELHGMLEPDKVEILRRRIEVLEKTVEELEGERDEYKRLNERMLSGAQARKRSKEMTGA